MIRKALPYSFRHSLPVLISFIPVGLAYGILSEESGGSAAFTFWSSFFVFAGSLQFLMVSFLAAGTSLATLAVMAALLNSRHIFYGIPFISEWDRYGRWKNFLIFALPDETFSLHCSNENTGEMRKTTMILDAFLVWSYWVIPSITGYYIGSMLTFDTAGIDFSLTALFIVILLGQLEGKSAKENSPAVIAVISSLVCMLIFGPDGFILPSLLLSVGVLLIMRPKEEKA